MSYTLNRAVLPPLVEALRLQYPHRTFQKPLATAIRCLLDPTIPWEWKGFVLHIKSRTTDDIYRCTGDTCTCPARVTTRTPFGWCWHKIVWSILIAEWAITDPFGLIRR